MNIEQTNQHYLYIVENNDMVKYPFFWRNYDKKNKIHFKNVLRALKTNKNLEYRLKRTWITCTEKKRVVSIEFFGIYKDYWTTAQDIEKYHNLFKQEN